MTNPAVVDFRLDVVERQVDALAVRKADAEDVAGLRADVVELRSAVERLRNVILGAAVTVAGSTVLASATALYLGHA